MSYINYNRWMFMNQFPAAMKSGLLFCTPQTILDLRIIKDESFFLQFMYSANCRQQIFRLIYAGQIKMIKVFFLSFIFCNFNNKFMMLILPVDSVKSFVGKRNRSVHCLCLFDKNVTYLSFGFANHNWNPAFNDAGFLCGNLLERVA